uniref:non-specific serine/threonine protein kinase n=1 Tax=Palpitomonas bilix TaxID=652834 RepID=A0A7S3LWD3_9EUKA|mmetsp:Transcript_6390/g.15690  ORF Transcript_6390/g.15690 Transcript_6390/m.15690 type:complete len:859 (+) Transcript_6390:139-2715(+)
MATTPRESSSPYVASSPATPSRLRQPKVFARHKFSVRESHSLASSPDRQGRPPSGKKARNAVSAPSSDLPAKKALPALASAGEKAKHGTSLLPVGRPAGSPLPPVRRSKSSGDIRIDSPVSGAMSSLSSPFSLSPRRPFAVLPPTPQINMAKAMEDLSFDYKEEEKTRREEYQKSYLDTSIRRPPTRSGPEEREDESIDGIRTPPKTSASSEDASQRALSIEDVAGILGEVPGDRDALAFDEFAIKCEEMQRFFDGDEEEDTIMYRQVFDGVLQKRVLNHNWRKEANSELLFRAFQCLRILSRDLEVVKCIRNTDLIYVISESIDKWIEGNLLMEDHLLSDVVTQMLGIAKRIANTEDGAKMLVKTDLSRNMVVLLTSSDPFLLQACVATLLEVLDWQELRTYIARLHPIEYLLTILEQYDKKYKVMAAEAIEMLLGCENDAEEESLSPSKGGKKKPSSPQSSGNNCREVAKAVSGGLDDDDADMRHEFRIFGGVSIILNTLQKVEDSALVQAFLQLITVAAEDPDTAKEVHVTGGVPVILALINEDSPHVVVASSVAAVSCALARLALDDDIALSIRQGNGVYYLGRVLLHDIWLGQAEETGGERLDEARSVQAHILRALRFLFSVERNRRIFKRLFPPFLFDAFIDVGHYVFHVEHYMGLVDKLRSLPPRSVDALRKAFEETNVVKQKTDSRVVHGYQLQELLGAGAFGRIYQAQRVNPKTSTARVADDEKGRTWRDSEGMLYAVKELPMLNADVYSSSSSTFDTNGGGGNSEKRLKSEVDILKRMKHPNIVEYYESFTEGDNFYIVMELVEGTTLLDHLNSISEKGKRMPEQRIWHFFLQVLYNQHRESARRVSP